MSGKTLPVTGTGIREAALALWESGRVLRAWLGEEEGLFPFSVCLGDPQTTEALPRFTRLGGWLEAVERGGKCHTGQGYRIEYAETGCLGPGQMQRRPRCVVFDTPFDLIAFLGKQGELGRFARLSRLIRRRFPGLESWIRRQPLHVLALGPEEWPPLLDLLARLLADRQQGRTPQQSLLEAGGDPDLADSRRPLLLALLEELAPGNRQPGAP